MAQLQQEGLVRAISPRIRVVADRKRAAAPTGIVLVLTGLSGAIPPSSRNIVHRLFFGVIAALAKHGLAPLIQPCGDVAALRAKLASTHAEGLILLQDLPHDALTGLMPLLEQPVCPTVVTGDVFPPEMQSRLGCEQVCIDHAAGAHALTRLLIAQGCRRILRLHTLLDAGSPDPLWLQERDRGHQVACAEAGVAVLPPVGLPHPPWEGGEREAWHRRAQMTAGFLLQPLAAQPKPDALMLESDGDFFDAVRACRLLGRDPVGDLRIVGYDNYWESLPESRWDPTVPLATIDPQYDLIGAAMVEALLARKDGSAGAAPRVHRIEGRLVRPRQG